VDTLTVADNIFLGAELRTRFGLVDAARQVAATQQILDQLNIAIDPHAIVEDLSPAQKQTLQIVKALHRDARVLIMDEPTSSLGEQETAALMTLTRSLVAGGIGVIYISHYLEEVFEIGDRITVLKDGRAIATRPRAECTTEDVIHDMVGRDAGQFFRKTRGALGDVVLRVEGYSRGARVKNVSFEVRSGEVFGIGGMVGAGRTELLNLLFGVDKRDAGRLMLQGVDVTPTSPAAAIRAGICLITENRKETGLFLPRPVRENVAIVENQLAGGVINLKTEASEVDRLVGELQIRLATIEQPVESLSGGNQQKSLLARWLAGNFAVFMFDEPTKGVDIGAKEEIYRLITALAARGAGILMVSSDMPELLSLSDRIGVMRNGEMVATIDAAGVTEESLVRQFLGLDGSEVGRG